jgi:hypothetical protein
LGDKVVEWRVAALREALFRQTGEVHRWAYDIFSLGRLHVHSGFDVVERQLLNTSNIPDFGLFDWIAMNWKRNGALILSTSRGGRERPTDEARMGEALA